MRKLLTLVLSLVLVFNPVLAGAEEEILQAVQEDSVDASAPATQVPNEVLEVRVQGNQIVSTNTILSKMKTQQGARLSQETVNADLKRLYATGFFQDIQFSIEESPEGYVLVISVDEKPIVRSIRLEGFTVFKEAKLRKEMNLIEGQIMDQRAIKEGVEAIRKLYNSKGYRFVDISTNVDVDTELKEAELIIEIQEGEKFKIENILFEGVTAFKDKELLKLMKTRKKKLFASGVFKEEDFEKDLERLRLFYQKEGYLDANVSPNLDYDKANQRITITITADEGQHYVTGEIQMEGNSLFPEAEILQELEMLPGLTYSQFYLFEDVDRIRNYYLARGYMEARVVPDVKLNRDSGKVDVTYRIEEGDLFFVDKVIVRGNTKTKDIVIRRELRIRPGERFDGEKIEISKQRLNNLGYFEDVTFDSEPSQQAPNRRDIIFRVKEKRTGELSFGGGVSSIDSFLGFGQISQKNFDLWNWPRFTGGGQSLSLRARIGTISQDIDLSFVEPYLFNKPISLGVDGFNVRRDDKNVDFEQERSGGRVTLARTFWDKIRLGTAYTLENVDVDEVSSDAAQIVRDFEGDSWLSRTRFFASYDTRDSVFNPKKGVLINWSGEMIGGWLGGEQDYYIMQGGVSKYWAFTKSKKHVVELKLRFGVADEFGDSTAVPVFDRFYAGGLGSVRGFDFRRVGPIDGGDAVGGETMGIFNVEYTFPIPLLEAFRGAFFLDAGHVNFNSYEFDTGEVAVSVGPGIKIKTPIGPVAFYYGYPIANEDVEDENGRLEFSLGRGF